MKNSSFGALQNPCQTWQGLKLSIARWRKTKHFARQNHQFGRICQNLARCAKFWQGVPKFRKVCQSFAGQTPSEDDFSEDEWLSFTFLGVMEASNLELCMPYWIRDIEGRLVKIETPQETETNGLKRQISNFSLRRMRNSMSVGRGTWKLSTYFYDGMSSSMKQLLKTMCGGDFMSKNPEEAMDFLSYVSKDVWRMKSQPNAKGGMYVLSEDMDMKEKFATMARRLEELELKKVQEVPFTRHECKLRLVPYVNLMSIWWRSVQPFQQSRNVW
ncbi:hypothetical protein AAG906_017895 [Vitis piasezkii]